MKKVTLRSDRKTDYTFTYKGEEFTLPAGGVFDVADGLTELVLPTSPMKVIRGLIVIKDDETQK